jgi:hypothetical protein
MVRKSERASEVAENLIEIRVNDIAQLFHTLDPFPFRERDLADEAEDYIVHERCPATDPSRLWCTFRSPTRPPRRRRFQEKAEGFDRPIEPGKLLVVHIVVDCRILCIDLDVETIIRRRRHDFTRIGDRTTQLDRR